MMMKQQSKPPRFGVHSLLISKPSVVIPPSPGPPPFACFFFFFFPGLTGHQRMVPRNRHPASMFLFPPAAAETGHNRRH